MGRLMAWSPASTSQSPFLGWRPSAIDDAGIKAGEPLVFDDSQANGQYVADGNAQEHYVVLGDGSFVEVSFGEYSPRYEFTIRRGSITAGVLTYGDRVTVQGGMGGSLPSLDAHIASLPMSPHYWQFDNGSFNLNSRASLFHDRYVVWTGQVRTEHYDPVEDRDVAAHFYGAFCFDTQTDTVLDTFFLTDSPEMAWFYVEDYRLVARSNEFTNTACKKVAADTLVIAGSHYHRGGSLAAAGQTWLYFDKVTVGPDGSLSSGGMVEHPLVHPAGGQDTSLDVYGAVYGIDTLPNGDLVALIGHLLYAPTTTAPKYSDGRRGPSLQIQEFTADASTRLATTTVAQIAWEDDDPRATYAGFIGYPVPDDLMFAISNVGADGRVGLVVALTVEGRQLTGVSTNWREMYFVAGVVRELDGSYTTSMFDQAGPLDARWDSLFDLDDAAVSNGIPYSDEDASFGFVNYGRNGGTSSHMTMSKPDGQDGLLVSAGMYGAGESWLMAAPVTVDLDTATLVDPLSGAAPEPYFLDGPASPGVVKMAGHSHAVVTRSGDGWEVLPMLWPFRPPPPPPPPFAMSAQAGRSVAVFKQGR